MRTIIIDDEEKSRQVLRQLLKHCCDFVELVDEAGGVEEGINSIKRYKPDLVLLDVRMPDGTGFDLLNELFPVSFKVIFITAFEEYAITAFKYSAVDYITKPIDAEELRTAVEKAVHINQLEQVNGQLRQLIDDHMRHTGNDDRIALRTSDTVYFVEVNDIIRCESEGNYTTVFMANKESVVMSKPIKEFETMLAPRGFLRIHNSHLINLKHLRKYRKDDLNCIMSDKSVIEVSYRKKEELNRLIRNL